MSFMARTQRVVAWKTWTFFPAPNIYHPLKMNPLNRCPFPTCGFVVRLVVNWWSPTSIQRPGFESSQSFKSFFGLLNCNFKLQLTCENRCFTWFFIRRSNEIYFIKNYDILFTEKDGKESDDRFTCCACGGATYDITFTGNVKKCRGSMSVSEHLCTHPSPNPA